MLKIIKENNFESEVLKSEKVVLVDFYADWCGPCKMVGPILEKIAKEQNDFDIAKLNVDSNSHIAQAYGVQSIPTMMVFKNGKPVDLMVGFAPEPRIIDFVKKNL